MRYQAKLMWLGLMAVGAVRLPAQQATPQSPGSGAPIFRSETRLVPVDVVVMDKKQNYVHDLEMKDFKVWEDNKEYPIKTFSFEADPASPMASQQRYIVLFFDNSSMGTPDQIQARQAAGKFIDSNAGPNRLMAIVNFGGSLQISQNFTDDIERLKAVVNGTKFSVVGNNSEIRGGGPGRMPRLGEVSQFGVRTSLLALRNMAQKLGDVPGRKTLVLFSAGFPLDQEMRSEATAVIDACNKSNVAIYPIDVRGLTAPSLPFAPGRGALILPGALRDAGVALAGNSVLQIAAFFQRGSTGGAGGGGAAGGGAAGGGGAGAGAGGGGAGAGGGGGGGVVRSGGAAGGTGAAGGGGGFGGAGGAGGRGGGIGSGGDPSGRGGFGNAGNTGGGGGGNVPRSNPNDPYNRSGLPPRRVILPPSPESATTNQEVLYLLADGTGGFVILNTNDLVGGLQKINKEQNEYYLLAYTPPDSAEGSCHTIKVKVNRGGMNVRARTGYCNVKQIDLLSGKPAEKDLEARVAGTAAPTIAAPPMQTPFFYTSPNTARVMVAMEIPMDGIKFQKVKGKQHAEMNVLGIAYRPDGNVAGRFSDNVKWDFDDKKEVEAFGKKPYRYESQFDLGSGDYSLKVAFSSGESGFGKLESPLKIEPFDGKQFAMSALAMSRDFHKIDQLDAGLDAALQEGRTPLVTGGLQFKPAGSNAFKPTETVAVYFEVYEPLLAETEGAAAGAAAGTKVGAQLRIVDRKTGEAKLDSGGVEISNFIKAGNPVMSVALKVPVNTLTAGSYRLELKTLDSAGKTATRTEDFDII